MSEGAGRLDLVRLLAGVEAAPPVDAVAVLARELAARVGATDVSLLIANISGTAAVRMVRTRPASGSEARAVVVDTTESVTLAGSVHHDVLTTQRQHVERGSDGWDVLVPVTERGDAMGILSLTVPDRPSAELLGYVESAALALAYVVIAARRHTDLFESAQRDVRFSLAAEIQRRLLPSSYTVEGGRFTLAGWLEPAANVGGDTFDYSVGRDHLYASVTDAMGHSTEAALLATLAVGSLRNARRAAASPVEQADAANAALTSQATGDQFVTGHVMRIGLTDGVLEMVNAGHPPPYLLRDGVADVVEVRPGLPLGIDDWGYESATLELRPGDRLVVVTDGFLERNALAHSIVDILERSAGGHAREFVRELGRNVLHATGGDLRDDATVLCIDWSGPGRT